MPVRTVHRSAARRSLITAAVTVVAVALAVGGYLALADDSPAPADADQVTDGSFHWGFKQSFRTYIAGGGSITVDAPATYDPVAADPGAGSDAARPYAFPVTGTAVRSANDLSVQTEGSVSFANPVHGFVITLGAPSLEVDGTGARVVADMSLVVDPDVLPDTSGLAMTDVTIAEIGDVDVDVTVDGPSSVITGTGITLTAAGAAYFNDVYAAGTVVDDLTVRTGPPPAGSS